MITLHTKNRRLYRKEAAVPEKEQRLLCVSTLFDKKVHHAKFLTENVPPSDLPAVIISWTWTEYIAGYP